MITINTHEKVHTVPETLAVSNVAQEKDSGLSEKSVCCEYPSANAVSDSSTDVATTTVTLNVNTPLSRPSVSFSANNVPIWKESTRDGKRRRINEPPRTNRRSKKKLSWRQPPRCWTRNARRSAPPEERSGVAAAIAEFEQLRLVSEASSSPAAPAGESGDLEDTPFDAAAVDYNDIDSREVPFDAADVDSCEDSFDATAANDVDSCEEASPPTVAADDDDVDSQGEEASSTHHPPDDATFAALAAQSNLLGCTSGTLKFSAAARLLLHQNLHHNSSTAACPEADQSTPPVFPVHVPRRVHWADDNELSLFVASEYSIDSEAITVTPALPPTGVPAPPVFKASTRTTVIDREEASPPTVTTCGMTPKQKFQTIRVQALASVAEANLIVAREIKKTEWEEENDYSTSMAPTYGVTPKQKFQTTRVQALASVAEANLIVAREIKKMEWEEENDYSTSMAPTYGMTSKQKFQTIRVQALASVAEANLIVAKEIEKTEWEEENDLSPVQNLDDDVDSQGEEARSTHHPSDDATLAALAAQSNLLGCTGGTLKFSATARLLLHQNLHHNSSTAACPEADQSTPPVFPVHVPRRVHWADDNEFPLFVASEYSIDSEAITVTPALPPTGVPAPPVFKSSTRTTVTPFDAAAVDCNYITSHEVPFEAADVDSCEDSFDATAANDVDSHEEASPPTVAADDDDVDSQGEEASSTHHPPDDATFAALAAQSNLLGCTSGTLKFSAAARLLLHQNLHHNSSTAACPEADQSTPPVFPVHVPRRIHWADDNELPLFVASEYSIDSEAITVTPALPPTGVPAPPVFKSSTRTTVIDRVGLMHERRLADFLSLLDQYLKIVETEEDREYWLDRTARSLFVMPTEATTLKCDLFYFKPILPFFEDNDLPYIFSILDGEHEGGEGCFWKLINIAGDDKDDDDIVPVRRSCRLSRVARVNYAE